MNVDELPEVGPWARDKLERLRKYLSAYTRILSKQHRFQGFVFIDAFAGAGRAAVRPKRADPHDGEALTGALLDLEEFRADAEAREMIDGSPRVALGIEPPFSQYVFVERDPVRASALRRLETEFRGRRNVRIYEKDCNEYLREKLIENASVNWRRWRGIVLLDPFGMQVPWSTVQGLAATKALEVVINFPVGMAIQRLLRVTGKFTDKERKKLDSYFGDPSWYGVVYRTRTDLFSEPLTEKVEDSGRRLAEWYADRLRQAFGYASSPYLIRNTKGGHLYYLIWAGRNPTGAKIAGHVLRGGIRAAAHSHRARAPK